MRIYLQHPSPIRTWSVGHSHLYVTGLHTRSEPQEDMEGSHGSQRSLPTEVNINIFETKFMKNIESNKDHIINTADEL